MIVYRVLHRRHNDETGENTKGCGFFSTPKECRQAITELVKQPGFRDYPNDFKILEFPVDTIVSPDRFLSKRVLPETETPVDPEKLQYMWYATADDEYLDFAVMIGVFSSEDHCRRVIDLLADEPEFWDHRAGFGFEAASPGVVFWQEGFFSEPVDDEDDTDLPAWLLKGS